MLTEIATELQRWRERGERFALATLVGSRGSSPRPLGSTFGVAAGGELAGSVSGGCVESEVVGVAQEVLAGGPPRSVTYGISDDLALEVGLPCGGEIDVFVYELRPEDVERALAQIRSGEPGAMLVRREGDGVGGVSFLDSAQIRDELAGLAHSRVVGPDFAHVFGPPPRLVVFGAVDTAEALCAAARSIGWRTVVTDPRARFATHERIPSADDLIVAWPDEALAVIRPDTQTAIVVLTHEDRFDVPALVGALETDAFYVGAIGSRRTQSRRRERLVEAGVTEAGLERIAGPSGLDIGAHSPAETAISILAEILAVRAGRDGGRLRDASGRIHATA